MKAPYFNREISWLDFNARVLEEAMDTRHPLLEQVKFLSIVHSNLDEFFMIRVSGLQEQVDAGVDEPARDGLTPSEQLAVIRDRVNDAYKLAWQHYRDELRPRLAAAGVSVLDYSELTEAQRAETRHYFDTVAYPILTPLAVDPGHPFPHISNLSISLAVEVEGPDGSERFARVKIPASLPRLIPVRPTGDVPRDVTAGHVHCFVWLEQVVSAHLGDLFRGMRVAQCHPFRVTRDADLEIREDEAGDLLETIRRSLVRRRFGSVSQLVVASAMPDDMRRLIMRNMEVKPSETFAVDGPLGMSDIMGLLSLPLPHLKDRPLSSHVPLCFRDGADVFAAIRDRDILVHHPFDSFEPTIGFVQTAARDSNVLAIKQTIYRVGTRSPIVDALAEASLNGKQVSVVVELKARFDEEHNIEWARALEASGVHVVYGDVELKTHCKLMMVVRRESDGIRRYVHLGTGNYNAKTAALYTDFGLFTCDPDTADDVSSLFNALTGYSLVENYRKLLVSPVGIRRGIGERVAREADHARSGRGGRIIMKMNSFTDARCADALYEASQAGVEIDLIVRGSCCVVPGIPGVSERIRVRSIVGRFLEHDRVYYFRNGGSPQDEVWLGSADVMSRNLDRRVETLFPIDDPTIRRWLADQFLETYLHDNVRARLLHSDGTCSRIAVEQGDRPFEAQSWFIAQAALRDADTAQTRGAKPLRVGD